LTMSALEISADELATPCMLVVAPAGLLPIIAGSFDRALQRSVWASDEDYERGYNAIAGVLACMTKGCIDLLIESNDRIYRLLDTSLNGAEYIADELEGETIITPPIPAAPAPAVMSIHARLLRLEQVQDNAMNGTIHGPDYTDPVGVRQLLADIKAAIEAGEASEEDLLPALEQIIVLLA